MVTTRRSQSKAEDPQPKIDDALGASDKSAAKDNESKPPKPKSGSAAKKREAPEDEPAESKEEQQDETHHTATHADKKAKMTGDAIPPPLETTSAHTAASKALADHPSVLEFGQIHFLYKPKVETFHPHSIDDVQRLHIILQPHALSAVKAGKDDAHSQGVKSRLLNVGRKILPDQDTRQGSKSKQPFWAFVSAVAEDVDELHAKLGEVKNETKTKGTRTTPADRLIASGPYLVLLHPSSESGGPSSDAPSSNPTSLLYRTTLPGEPGEVQKAFRIGKQGAFTISVKNPKYPNTGGSSGPSGVPGGLRGNQKAEYPDNLQARFQDNRWHPLNPPTFLDHVSSEILFIAHPGDAPVQEDAGQEIADELREIADEGDLEHINDAAKRVEVGERIEEGIWEMLDMREEEKETLDGEPAIDGKWD